MRILLDTQVVLWSIADDPRLDGDARDATTNLSNTVFVSAASVWEAEIKRVAGRLAINGNLLEFIAESGFRTLPITDLQAVEAARLPPHHRDPFDRMLVAQARLKGLTLITADMAIAAYDVDVIPA